MDSLTSLLKTILPCLSIGTVERGIRLSAEPANYQHISEKAPLQRNSYGGEPLHISCEEAATSIVSAMSAADKNGPSLDATIKSLVHQAGGWSNYLASKILAALTAALEAGVPMNAAMQESYDKAYEGTMKIEAFAADHPEATAVFFTVIALGVLVLLAPYVVEWLGFCIGFGEEGPIAGEWCFLQSVAMTKVY